MVLNVHRNQQAYQGRVPAASYLVAQQKARDGGAIGQPALGVQVLLPAGHSVERGLVSEVKHQQAAVRVAVVGPGHRAQPLHP